MASGNTRTRMSTILYVMCLLFNSGGNAAQINYSLQEESKTGVTVGNIAKDLGIDPTLLENRNLRIVAGTKQELFRVNHEDGALFVNQRIDREELCAKTNPCLIHLKAVIENPLEMHQISVDIIDVNDNPPSFLEENYTLEILESAMTGARFQLETAHDPDIGSNDLQAYKLSQNHYFRLETEDMGDEGKIPVLILQKPLDREKSARHKLILTATDGGKPQKSTTVNITIVVSDVNDNTPVCDKQKYTVKVKENAPEGTFLLRVNASDSDDGRNGEIEYSLRNKFRNGASEVFDLDSLTGELKIKGGLNYEERQVYELKIVAADKGAVSLSTLCNVLVNVEDVNDNRPEIDVTSVSSHIPEDAPPGTVVALMGVTDLDSGMNGKIVCALPTNIPFDLKPSPDGNFYSLVTKEQIDKESKSSYDITITAKDLGTPSLSSTRSIHVEVTDVNDNSPAFTQSPYTFYVVENNKPGIAVFSLSAADIDEGENARVSYSIDRVNSDQRIISFLSINEANGTVYSLKSFDFESLKTFQFFVLAKDSGSPSLSSNVTVNVFILDQNDNVPVILYPVSANGSAEGVEEIPRNVNAGHLVTKVRAYDADIGYNGWLLFSLQEVSEHSLFSLDRYTGQIRTLRSFTETDEAQHKLLILVKDNGNVSLSATATVIVKVVEPKEAFAASDVKNAVKDEEENDVTFYLIITLGSVSVLFVISIIVLIVMQCSKSTDYSSKYLQDTNYDGTLCHSIQYRSGDKRYMLVGPRMSIGSTIAPGSNRNTLVIPDRRRRDSGEQVSAQIRYSIPEEVKEGTIVGNIAKDLGLEVSALVDRRFRIVSGSNDEFFQVNQNGVLHVHKKIDRESLCDSHNACMINLKIVVENPLEIHYIGVEVIDVNDNPPTFSEHEKRLEILESTARGTRFQLKAARDPDAGGNSIRTYKLTQNEHFDLEVRDQGEDKLPFLVLQKTLDREINDEYNLVLTAIDGGNPQKSGTLNITINVLDLNDNRPFFSQEMYSTTLKENIQVGTLVIQVQASDADYGSNGEVTYAFGSDQNPKVYEIFSLDKLTGDIRVKGDIDFEDKSIYKLEVQASDNGQPPMKTDCRVVIKILDTNDNTPEIDVTSLSKMVPEDSRPGTVISLISVTDRDTGVNGKVVCTLSENVPFELKPSVQDNMFSLVTKRNLDREIISNYDITITATDLGQPPLSSFKTLSVQVSDVNDNPPEFSINPIELYMIENNAAGAAILTLSAFDKDLNENSVISYQIIKGNDVTSFLNINSETGAIYALKSFDFETTKKFQFNVLAKDSGSPSLSSNVTVNVFILDQNDNVPVILYPVSANGSAEGVEEIPRNVNAGHLVTKVRAYDADIGYNGWLLFSLPEVSEHSLFSLDRYTGQIRTLRSFTETDEAQHKLLILVKDNGNVSLSATATVIVKVVEPKEAFAASDVKNAVKDEEENDVTFYLIITLGSVSVLFVISIIVLIVMQCSKSTDYSSKYLQDTNYDGTLCHSIQYRSGDKRYMLVGPRMSIGSTIAPGSNRNTLVIPDRRRRDSGEATVFIMDAGEQRRRWEYWWISLCFYLLLCLGQQVSAQIRYTVPEEVKEGAIVGNIAKDLGFDVSALMDRRFRIVSGSNDALFQVNQNNGILYVDKLIDREALCDGTDACLISLKTVVENPLEVHYVEVEITDVNDHAPVFADKDVLLEIAESTLPGEDIQLQEAQDPDAGVNSVRFYKLSQNEYFELELRENGGEKKIPILKLRKLLDRERQVTHSLILTAVDGGNPPRSGSIVVNVTVLDDNDNRPKFSQELYSVTLQENAPVVPEDSKPGTVISLVSITDKDSGVNGKVVCRISDNVPFELKPSFKDNMYSLVTNAKLDRELVSRYDVTITATDLGQPPLSSIKTLKVQISDVNDNVPEFPHNPLELYLMENNAPGAFIYSVSAFDKDMNENAAITYQIIREDGAKSHLSSFLNVNSDNGHIHALKSFDFETLKTFQFHVLATDSGSPSLSSNVTVNVFILDQNDNVPVILYPVSANGSAEGVEEIPRNVNAGHLVTKVRAYDADIGYNGWLLFSLQEVSEHSLFSLDRYTGQIRTLRSFTETDEAQHKLLILVKDNGNVSLSATATVIVKVVEPKEAFAASDVKNAVKDEEENDVTFYLIITLGSVSVLFVISIIVLIVMQCSKSTDYSSKYLQDTNYDGTLCHSIQYRSGDKRYMLVGPRMSIGSTIAPGSNRNTLVIPDRRRRDSGELLSAQIRYSIPEEVKEGYVVGNIAKDLGLDASTLMDRRFRIVSGSDDALFVVNQNNGVLYVQRKIDREKLCDSVGACLINLKIVVENPLEIHYISVEINDVNDHAPTFTEKEKILEISEHTFQGTRFQLQAANDPDSGVNSVRLYKLSQNEHFDLEIRDRAEDKLPFLVLQKPLDREQNAKHSIILTAIDGGNPPRSGSLNITVLVLDVNDNRPVFSQDVYSSTLHENVQNGTLVMKILASDSDYGPNGDVTYTFGGANNQNIFSLDRLTGEIRVIGEVDFEKNNVYKLDIQASDNGQPPLTTDCRVILKILDINDNKPTIEVTSLSKIVPEDSRPGTVISLISVTDRDTGVNGKVVCTLSENVPFEVKPSVQDNMYSLVTKGVLDRETVSHYDITITAMDLGQPPLSSFKTLSVQVSDVNDNPPEFSINPIELYMIENNAAGTAILTLSAFDKDLNENSVISYQIIKGNGTQSDMTSFLNTNSETGAIYALKSFDFETTKKFQFQVLAKDSGSPSLSSNVTVNVFILDQNDNVPVILYPVSANGSAEGVEEIPRNVNAGHLVTKVRAYDADIGYNGWLLFSLQEVSEHSLFSLDRYTGQIRTLRSFTETDEAQHKLLILVKDNGNVSLSATATVIVKVVEPKEAFAASDVKNAVKDEEENDVTFYLIITLGSVSVLFVISIIVLIVMQCSKSTDYSSKYLQDTNYDGTLCHSIQYRSGDKRYMLVGPRMSIGSTIAPGSNRNTLVIPDRRRRDSGEVTVLKQALPHQASAETHNRVLCREKGQHNCVQSSVVSFFAMDVGGQWSRRPSWWITLSLLSCFGNLVCAQIKYNVPEEVKEGSVVGNIAKDLNLDISNLSHRRFRIVSGPDDALFQVNQNNGELYVNKRIDREKLCDGNTVCSISLKCVVEDPLEVHYIEVEITDVNDNPPIFPRSEQQFEIAEHTLLGTRFQVQTARDPDLGTNTVRYYKLSQNELFDIDIRERHATKIPFLVLKKALDRERQGNHRLTLTAIDGGNPPKSGTLNIYVIVLDINDNRPVFSRDSYSATILENAPLGTVVIKINATDLDDGINGEIEYSLGDNLDGKIHDLFKLDKNTGELQVKGNIDFEETDVFKLDVQASDKGQPPLITEAELNIKVTDVNDNSPEIEITSLSSVISENANPGTAIALISVSDKDSDSGSPSLSSNVTVNVFILDQNDNVPVILYPVSANGSAEGVEEIPRNVNAGHLVTKVRAYDADIGYNGWLLFSLPEVSEHSLFSLDRYTGQIRTLRSFTETDEAQHKLLILVKDNGNVSLSATATVIVKVVEPKEAFAASDVKNAVKDEEENYVTFYLIITLGSVSVLFVISIIVLIVMQCSKSTDYSSKYLQDTNYDGTLCHSIQYRSGDKRYMLVGPRMSIGSTIAPGSNRNTLVIPDRRRRDSGEHVSAQIRYSIPEELKEGSVVGHIAKDLGLDVSNLANRRLRIVSGSKDALFQVNPNNGVLYVQKIIDREELCDGNGACLINLKMVVEDPLEIHYIGVQIIDVNDNSPTFTEEEQHFEIAEHTPTGTRFQIQAARDADTTVNNVRSYKLSQNEHFEVETKDRDEEKIPLLVLKKALDRENAAEHRLILTAIDGGNPPRSGNLNIIVTVLDVNDNRPVFSQDSYSVTVKENAAIGTVLIKLNATDLDEGSNGVVEYAFGRNLKRKVYDLFKLDRATGEIQIKGELDFEETEVYKLDVQASDKGQPPWIVESVVNIKIIDINDNAPEIDLTSLSSVVSEDSKPGTVISLISISDRDSGINGKIVPSISDSVPFELKPAIQENIYSLVTKGKLDRELVSHYDITITVTDLGQPPLSSFKSMSVQVSDVNDNCPEFSQNPLELYLVENNAAGASILSVSASDKDINENAMITYNIIRGDAAQNDMASFLNINSETGVIYALNRFDFEVIKKFHFQVVARDSGTPPLSSNVTVNVFILDQNDNVPVILYPVSANGSAEGVEEIPRNVNAGHLVTKVRAYDADIGYNGWLLFSLQEVSEHSLFSLDRYTGQIRTLRSFTETDEAQHKLLILVKDNGNVSLSATATVIVKVVEPKEAFAASDVKNAVKDEEENDVTFYLIITLGSVSVLFVISIIVLIVMQCSKSTDYSSKYLQDTNYDGTLCHSIQYRSGDKRYMLVGPRMSIGSTIAPGSNRNTLVIPDRRRRDSGEKENIRELMDGITVISS
ncbi:protocadherin alpha-3-like [Pimephales promelas]|nr:protocadherin alpha-3-like [Pimephales promelas]